MYSLYTVVWTTHVVSGSHDDPFEHAHARLRRGAPESRRIPAHTPTVAEGEKRGGGVERSAQCCCVSRVQKQPTDTLYKEASGRDCGVNVLEFSLPACRRAAKT